MGKLKYASVLLTLPCVAYIIWNGIDDEALEDANRSTSLKFQQFSGKGVERFFKAVSIITSPEGGIPIIILLFYILPKEKLPSIYLAIYTIIAAYFISTVK